MKDNKLAIHTNAVNLARRWSIQNENDLMQEDFFEEERSNYTKIECQNLAAHLLHPKGLPEQCRKYTDVTQYLKRTDTDTAHPTQWMS